MFVIVTGDSAESSAPANETTFNKWLNDLPDRGISAHAFALKYRGGGVPDLVAQHVVQTAGGRFDFMNTANALPDKLKLLGEQIAERRQRDEPLVRGGVRDQQRRVVAGRSRRGARGAWGSGCRIGA